MKDIGKDLLQKELDKLLPGGLPGGVMPKLPGGFFPFQPPKK